MQWASAAWMVYFLAGGKPRQTVPTRLLWRLAVEGSGLPEWLCEECYSSVGDLAETLSLLLPEGAAGEEVSLDRWMRERLLAAARPRRGRAICAAEAMGGRAARRPAARLLQAHHRGIAHRRVAAAGGEGAGRGRGRRGEPHGAAHDRLCAGEARAVGRRFRGAGRRGGACGGGRRSTPAGPIPSISPSRGRGRSRRCRRRSGRRRTGSSNGSSTASGRSS